jgi:hypothetical protein
MIHTILDLEPKNLEAQGLLVEAESKFAKQVYESKFPRTAIPRIVVPADSIIDGIGSQEGFMLSRINGDWDIASILSICPFREADSLRMIIPAGQGDHRFLILPFTFRNHASIRLLITASWSALLRARAIVCTVDSSSVRRDVCRVLQLHSLAGTSTLSSSCSIKRSAKIVSLLLATVNQGTRLFAVSVRCAGKIELDFPGIARLRRHGFTTHTTSASGRLTEIKFEINGHQYSLFDDYNGENKPSQYTV